VALQPDRPRAVAGRAQLRLEAREVRPRGARRELAQQLGLGSASAGAGVVMRAFRRHFRTVEPVAPTAAPALAATRRVDERERVSHLGVGVVVAPGRSADAGALDPAPDLILGRPAANAACCRVWPCLTSSSAGRSVRSCSGVGRRRRGRPGARAGSAGGELAQLIAQLHHHRRIARRRRRRRQLDPLPRLIISDGRVAEDVVFARARRASGP
jgi:hypothetical protein